MTVSTTDTKVPYVGNGVADTFAYNFKILASTDLEVYLYAAGEELSDPLDLDIDYTVTGAGAESGGNVVFTSPPAASINILIRRILPVLQPVDFKNQGRFFPETHERAFDRGIMVDQQQKESQDRSIKIPPQVSGVSTEMPTPVPLGIWAWNAAGNAPRYFTAAELATTVAYADKRYQVLTGTGAQTIFTLNDDPGSIGNLEISIDGVMQVPVTDFTYVDTALTFAVAPSSGAVILVRYDEALPVGTVNSSQVVPTLGEPSNAKLYGVTGNGVTDDSDAFESWIDYLQVSGLDGYIPPGNYLISYIRRRTLTKNLRITCSPAAVFIGTSTKQDYAGAGQTSFTVTVFEPSANGFVVVHISALGVETVLTENTHYTVTGQVINTAAGSAPFGAVAVGATLRVVSANGMIELGANALGGCEIDWVGGKIDASARGYAVNTGSGSGIVFYNTRRGSCRDLYAYASDDWEAATANGLGGDSGITTLSCDNFEISGCLLVGWGDLGVYATGSGSALEVDDGYGVTVHHCGFIKCQSAASVKRGGQASHIHHCWARECNIGFSFYPTGGNADGGRGSIHDNFGLRIGRIFVDCRATKGVVVHSNTLIDIGYAPDGVTARTNPSAYQFQGVEDGIIHNNVARLQDWALNNQRGIVFGIEASFGGQTIDSTAHHNKIVGFSVGVIESGAGTGNAFLDNELLSCTTPISSILSTTRCSYWDGTARRSNVGTALQEESGTYTPTLTNTTNITSSTAYPAQWSRVGRTVTVSGRVEVTATADSSGTELRLSLPIAPTFTALGECCGAGSFGDVQGGGADVKIRGQVAGANARFNYTTGTSAAGAVREMTYTFTYYIP